jgi:hypothetical protein
MSRSLAWIIPLVLVGCSGGRNHESGTPDLAGHDTDMGTTPGGCQGLACFQMDCGSGLTTTVSGKVTAPNGLDPVYQALVYVPAKLIEFPQGAQCEVCNDPIGGTPIVSTTTAVDGTFTLTNVPATTQVPVVVQKGRFRKTSYIDISACADNPLSADESRLPRNQSEGDLPKMAVGVGDYDQIECVLRSIGLDDSEFGAPASPGAVHLFDNGGGGTPGPDSLETLLYDANRLSQYNLLFVNCTNATFDTYMNQPLAVMNLFNYVNSGGRLYVTDWSYDYMEQVPQFAPYVYFDGGGSQTTPQPIGAAQWIWDGSDLAAKVGDPTLASWLQAAGASPNGDVTIIGSWALALSTAADQMTYPSQTWVHGVAKGVDRPMTVTYDYNMCGKVLWSSYHTQEPGGAGSPFPGYCVSTPQTMIPQEKILEYLIFEISACSGQVG